MHMLDTEFESVNSYSLGSTPGSIGLSNASDFSVYLNPFQVTVSAGNRLISPKTIAFVDASVSDALTIASNLEADIKVILDPTKDGISQITEVLSQYDGLTGIEIISHGNAAALQLGNSLLSQNSLQQYAPALQQWSSSLTSDADILLYGCNIASDEFGQAFVDNLSALTGADVAASTNLTGNSARGGDWTLEYTTGSIETAIPLGESLISTYQGLLPSLFTTQTPTFADVTDGSGSAGDYELGMEFTSTTTGSINSIRYYKASSETGPHVGKIWSDTGTLLASVTFTNETASGWQEQTLSSPLAIAANTKYVVSVNVNEYYVATPAGLATTLTNGDLSAVADGSNGVFSTTPDLFPAQSFNNGNYFRDINFSATSVTSTLSLSGTPTQNQILTAAVANVPGLTTTGYQWQQSSDGTTWVDISGATNQTLTLGGSQVGKQVRALATFEDVLNVEGLLIGSATSPIAPIVSSTQSIFTSQTPTLTNLTDGSGSAGDYEMGVEFTSAKAGTISSIRYYKDANETGPHVGKIWSDTGTLLASVNFTNETASGWQEQTLSTPLAIAANTKYVVSVNANTYYVATPAGLGTTVTNGDLSAVADGSNGVFNTTPDLFPTQSFNNGNYFRDIAFTSTSVTSSLSLSGTPTQNQALTATVANVSGLTTTGYQWQQSSDGNTWTDISGATSQTLTLGASQVGKQVRALATYKDALNVEGLLIGSASSIVNPIVNSTQQNIFTTQTPTLTNLSDGVGSAGDYEMGVEFTSTKAGTISSIRYYKDANETGPHVGKIWSDTGTLLATVTFSNETASGWQEQALTTPLAIAANTKYVVSVNANTYYVATPAGLGTTVTNGDLSAVADGSNGVFNTTPDLFPTQSFNNGNYFRDIAFSATSVTSTITLSGTTTQNQTLTATVGNVAGLTTTGYQWQQSSDGNTWTDISGATNQTLTLGLSQVGKQVRALATFKDALNVEGLLIGSATSPIDSIVPIQSIFTTQTPTLTNLTDGFGSEGDYEMGVEFTSAKAGTISSIRYYKATGETGPHVGKIWSDTGVLLASVTFTNETASGWQEQTLSNPLAIAANTKYVVSVNANTHYVATPGGLATTITNGNISAVADDSNGIFNATPDLFPTQSFNNTNYFRDLSFTPTAITSTVTLSGSTALYQNITATVGNVPGLTTTGYQWQQSSDGITWTNIIGATNQILTLGAFQAGRQVRALATFKDALGVEGLLIGQPSNPIDFIVSSQTQSTFTTQTPMFTNITDGIGSAGDYELGMEFVTTKAGTINAIRYYKSENETGTHIGNIWSSTGTLLASVTFTNETASGWQEQLLSSPLTIAANTKYVVSVNANTHYAATPGGLATTITNGEISTVADGSNGVLNVNPSAFPTQSFNNANYFRDIVYAPVISNPNNNLGAVSINGNATQNQILTATINDLDGLGGVTFKYQWQELVNGIWNNIAGATSQTLTLSQSHVGKQVRVSATYSDTLGTLEKVDSNPMMVANVNDTGLAILAGSAAIGASLKATILDPDGLTNAKSIQAGIDYQWQKLVNGIWTDIVGSNGFSLTLENLLLDQLVRVTAKYIDDLGTSETISSQAITVAAQNAIVIENQKLGTTDWIISETNQASTEIEGYANATSINKGETINLKVSLAQPGQYQIDVYRLGYYGGAGGRLITSIFGLYGSTQSTPIINSTTKLIEYQWNTSYALQTGTDWTSGLYFAKLTDSQTGKQNYIQFTVRDDNRPTDIGFQDAINTAAAYNNKGGNSTYDFNSPGGRAYQVSFDRPFQYGSAVGAEQFNNTLTWEYNMTRWLESQGYDVSYYTNVDVSINPLLLYSQKTYLSVGHDEYWTMEQRDNVERARDNGVNLAFFSANSAYWQVRYDPSSNGQANRVMTIYKDSSGVGSNPSLDPIAQTNPMAATTLFRSPQVNRPENSLLGVGYIGDIGAGGVYQGFDFVVSNASDPYYANTGLQNGDRLTGLVGYEYDGLLNNGLAPAGLVVLSQSPVPSSGLGSLGILPPGTNDTISNSVRYTAPSGAKVFSLGSIQWVWGLDSFGVTNPRVDSRAQQIAVNVFADMGTKPQTPDAGIVVS
jgi:uncharacterized protein YaiE (UPF0345 family)